MSDQVVNEAAEESIEVLPAETAGAGPDAAALGLELPEDKEEAADLLLSEVDKARKDATAYLDDLKRVAADFDNYRKRTIRDQASLHERAVEKVVLGLLPVMDTFDAALASEPAVDADQQVFS
ncbi:MAG: nucleotide exchange factor GrpE, partial [Actinomycetota bacterium]|nr:nucleotide exchange factor GrpE [Actinomycetota bacterium]